MLLNRDIRNRASKPPSLTPVAFQLGIFLHGQLARYKRIFAVDFDNAVIMTGALIQFQ